MKAVEGDGAAAAFERQELKVIFETMEKNDLHFQQLGPDQKGKIQEYVDALLAAGSPTAPAAAAASGRVAGKWRLEYSNEEKYKILPPGSDVYNFIYDKAGGRLDSVLMFPKSPIVRSIRVICDYTIDNNGQVDFYFKKTLVDLFGFTVPLPTFGDSSAFIEMQYFDGDLWMEQFEEPSKEQPGGSKVSVNVYRRIGELTEADKTQLKAAPKNAVLQQQ